ncbi:MAG: sugar-binding protein [Armatimonadetes bacterium]|nr:sugar-binding protein [Armatimonadota bacterium]
MNISRRLFSTTLLCGSFALFAASCQPTTPSTTDGSTPSTTGAATKTGESLSVAFVTNNVSDFWTYARRGTEAAEKESPGVKVDFVMPADGTAATQKTQVDDLLAKGVKAIAISPVDPANQTPYLSEVAKKVILITHDSDAPKSDRACYVGTDNVAAGRQAGEMVKEALGEKGGKIMLFVGKRDAQNAKEREQGIREALKGSNISVIDVRTDDTDRAKAKSNVSDALVKYPDIAGLVGIWSYNAPAILSAVEDASKVGKVKIVAFDEEEQTLAGVKSGAIHATIVQQPYEFGYQGVKILAALAKGDKSAAPASKQIFVPTQAIKKDTVEAFQTKTAELKGK